MKASSATTMPTKPRVVRNGDAAGERRKKCIDSKAKTSGATIECTSSVVVMDDISRPTAIVPPQTAHPTTA